MKQVTHYQKVMWGLHLEYSQINNEVYYRRSKPWERCYPSTVRSERRSKEEWDFINSKHYHFTKIDPVYCGTKQNFATDIERVGRYGYVYPSPYLKERSFGFRWDTRGRNSGFKKQAHIKKKELSIEEQDKRERAKKKRVHRHKCIKHYKETKGFKWYKTRANRTDRRKVKDMIKNRDLNYSAPVKNHYYEYDDHNYCDCTDNAWTEWLHPKRRETLNPWDYY